jgi:hypothetical protein
MPSGILHRLKYLFGIMNIINIFAYQDATDGGLWHLELEA